MHLCRIGSFFSYKDICEIPMQVYKENKTKTWVRSIMLVYELGFKI